MGKETWPLLKSCKHQSSEAGCGDGNDRLSQLPVDVLLLIMSFLPTKEAARTSILSYRWKHVWHHLPVLFFQPDSTTMEISIEIFDQLRIEKRAGFTRWVTSVVEAHLGAAIDEMKVMFDLDVTCESDIDKWLVFALSKQVKKLELNFTTNRSISLIDCYSWPLKIRMSHLGLHHKLASLRSLCIKFVNITPEDVECILLSCNVLEDLSIVDGCMYLTDIKFSSPSLQLKHLEVSCCPRMMCIDILAPKLVSFTYHGHPIALHIREASLLSKVAIGNGNFEGEVVAFAYSSLLNYFSQLEHLSWHLIVNHPSAPTFADHMKWNLGINNPAPMTNLKHLELHVYARCDETLLGWASLIEASPVLERLTLEFSGHARRYESSKRKIVKHYARPLRSLKTLELLGFYGLPIELEFVTFVVENSVALKEVNFSSPRLSLMRLPSNFKRCWEICKEFRRKLRSKGVIWKKQKSYNRSKCIYGNRFLFYPALDNPEYSEVLQQVLLPFESRVEGT